MNLADMLTFADIGQLTTIASHYHCECRHNSKHELIQSILVTLNRNDFIGQQIKSLPVDDLRFLNAILFESRSYFNVEELIAIIRQTSFTVVEGNNMKERLKDPSPREVIARFKKSGWIFNGMTPSTKYLFQVPKDLKERFRKELASYLRGTIIVVGEPAFYREEQGLLAEDLLLLQRYVHEQSIELNSESVMYRKYQQQLMESFHIAEPLLSKGGWRFGYGRTSHMYPSRLALMYDYSLTMGYMEEQGSKLLLTPKGIERLAQGKCEALVHIFRYWLRLYKASIPNITSLVYWIGQCAESWVTLGSLHNALGWLIKPYYYDTPDSILEHRILQMMMHLGLIRRGESEVDGTVFRMTAWGKKVADNGPFLVNDNTV
ncbi:hypothetical protein J2T13_004448 [Paenibacillus sp. DS2015]|uniref:hypothetical protein n=1 Tax=Paenibacillus sp. DS2015 TaxID=3373917 RepID=UPI003D1D7027